MNYPWYITAERTYNSEHKKTSILVDFNAEVLDNAWESSQGSTFISRRTIVNYTWISTWVVYSTVVLSLSFLNVGFPQIDQMIHNLNNPKTTKPGFRNHIINCLIIIATTIDGQVVTPSKINHVNRVIFWYCDTLANGDTLNQYALIWS